MLGELEHATWMQAASRLPKPYREVLVLCDVEDLSYREIVDRVGVPVGTVRSQLSRARVWVRRMMLG